MLIYVAVRLFPGITPLEKPRMPRGTIATHDEPVIVGFIYIPRASLPLLEQMSTASANGE
jgi:hypothetical protein